MTSTTSPTKMSRILELTEIISSNTRTVDDYLTGFGLPALSFDVTGPPDFPGSSSNEEIKLARRAVINATKELHDLMVGPREHVRWMAWFYNDIMSLQAVYQFKVAQAVPIEGDISWAELSKAIGVDESNTKRLVRHAMTNRVFVEPRAGYVAHNAASRVLHDDEQMQNWVGVTTSDFYQAAAKTVEAMLKYPASPEPAETGFSLYHEPGVPMFQIFGKDPPRAKRMGAAMASLTGGEGYEIDYLVDNYPWAELGEAVVVDVSMANAIFPHC
jgi:hypothetical protein